MFFCFFFFLPGNADHSKHSEEVRIEYGQGRVAGDLPCLVEPGLQFHLAPSIYDF